MKWIETQPDLDAAIARIATEPQVAVDTEADSLHSYFDKVCLIQISVPNEDLVVDPLQNVDLAPFGALLADPAVTKILHGGDYDLRILNRDFGYTVTNLIDTSICAQLLGYEGIGLAALLDRHFGVKADKAHQRADWARRPLPPDMLAYATMDTHYLIALAGKLRAELEALGRWEWALEEFARLENVRYRENDENSEPWRKLKNIANFDRRSLGVIRALHEWRDGLARKADKPPFKVIGNDSIVEIARAKPQSTRDLANVPTVARYHSEKYGREIVQIVDRALELPDAELPEKGESKAWIRDKTLEAKVEKLKRVRDRMAKELKVDPSVLGARHVLTSIAAAGTLDVPNLREWQKRVMGEALLASIEPDKKLF